MVSDYAILLRAHIMGTTIHTMLRHLAGQLFAVKCDSFFLFLFRYRKVIIYTRETYVTTTYVWHNFVKM